MSVTPSTNPSPGSSPNTSSTTSTTLNVSPNVSPNASSNSSSNTGNLPAVVVPQKIAPRQQLGDLPIDDLKTMAEEYGLSPGRESDKAKLIAAIHERRQLIATLDKAALIDVLEWSNRPIMPGASGEQMAMEIHQIRSMRFGGLSDRGLYALAALRGCELYGAGDRDEIIKRLKAQEGFFAKMGRKARGWVGKRLDNMMGDPATALPPPAIPPANGASAAPKTTVTDPPPRQQALKEEIESSGFFGGIANRVKRQADTYVNQKLDEIESRIDRKLDEIDRRLAEWRDKEIANRIRILKITLWVSVIVAVISLIYSYVQVQARHWNDSPPPVHVSPAAPDASSSTRH